MTTAIIHFQKNVPINQIKNTEKILFDSIIMLRFGETIVAKEILYGAKNL